MQNTMQNVKTLITTTQVPLQGVEHVTKDSRRKRAQEKIWFASRQNKLKLPR